MGDELDTGGTGHAGGRGDDELLRALDLDDSYDVVRVLAEGAGGRTELVTREGEGLLVRKRIPRGLANADAWEAACRARSPHLPTIRAAYWLPDAFVVAYDYVEGESAADLVARRGRLPEGTAVSIACDVCEAASALHAQGVVHRDITPGNVIVGRDGEASLVDLGIARRSREGADRDTRVLGTWGFAAPEQYGFAQTDARSDVYSIGCLVGYLLTGVGPRDGGFREGLADRRLVGAALARVVARAMAFEPSARQASADELAAGLRRAVREDATARAGVAEGDGTGPTQAAGAAESGAGGSGSAADGDAARPDAATGGGRAVGGGEPSDPGRAPVAAPPGRATPAAVAQGLRAAGGPLRAGALGLLLVGVLALVFFVGAALDMPRAGAADWSSVALTVLVGVGVADLASWQPLCALLRVGPYAGDGRLRTYLARVGRNVVAVVVIFVVLVFLSAALGSASGSAPS